MTENVVDNALVVWIKVDSAFGFGSADPGLIPFLRVILCFLPRPIGIMASKSPRHMEYELYGAHHGPSWEQAIVLVMPSLCNNMILSYFSRRRSAGVQSPAMPAYPWNSHNDINKKLLGWHP